MKRLIAVILVLTMAITFCACDANDVLNSLMKLGEKGIVDTWEADIDVAPFINEMFAEILQIENVIKSFHCRLRLNFYDDGTYLAEVDEGYLKQQLEKVMGSLWDAMIQMAVSQLGMSEDDINSMMESQGINKDNMLEMLELETLIPGFSENNSGYWKLENDALYLANEQEYLEAAEPVTIELTGNTLKFISIDGLEDSEYADYFFPMTFKRK